MKKNIKLVFIVCLVLGILVGALNLYAGAQRAHLAELEEQQAALHPAGQRQGAQRAVAVQTVGGADGRNARGDIVLRAAGEIQFQIHAPPCFSADRMVEYIYVL